MEKKDAIKECRLAIAVGEGDEAQVIFAAKILPDGKATVNGNTYYEPLVRFILGKVAPKLAVQYKGTKKPGEDSKIVAPTPEEVRCLRQ